MPFPWLYTVLSTSPPQNVSSIGTTGRDYSTLTAWEAATDNNLVASATLEVGQVYDDSDFNEVVIFAGATVDARYHRILEGADRFDPVTLTGAFNSDLGLGTGTAGVLIITENFFQVRYIGCSGTLATADVNAPWGIAANDVWLHGCFGSKIVGTNLANGCFAVQSGTGNLITCCIALASTGFGGAAAGFLVVPASSTELYNCIAYDIFQFAGFGNGFNVATGNTVKNCHAYGSGLRDFAGTYTGADKNGSSDGTAPGASVQTSLTAANEMVNPAGRDFRIRSGSVLENFGEDLSRVFTIDFVQATWNDDPSGWEVGPYSGAIGNLGEVTFQDADTITNDFIQNEIPFVVRVRFEPSFLDEVAVEATFVSLGEISFTDEVVAAVEAISVPFEAVVADSTTFSIEIQGAAPEIIQGYRESIQGATTTVDALQGNATEPEQVDQAATSVQALQGLATELEQVEGLSTVVEAVQGVVVR